MLTPGLQQVVVLITDESSSRAVVYRISVNQCFVYAGFQ